MPREKRVSLNVFLLKRGRLAHPQSAIQQTPGLRVIGVSAGGHNIGKLVVAPSVPKPPRWISYLENALEASLPADFWNANTRAVLLVERAHRFFAVTFGLGRFLLRPGVTDDSFGLKVTVNAIDPASIRSIDRRTFDALSTHTRSSASRAGSPDDFGIDIQRDLLRAVTGKPRQPELGTRMSGADSVHVHVAAQINALPRLLERLLERYGSDEYRQHFRWIDHIAEVRDERLRERAERLLIQELRRANLEQMYLAVPELVDWSQIELFSYSGEDPDIDEGHEDIHLTDFLHTVPDRARLDVNTLKTRYIHAYDADGRLVGRWSAWKCLNFETDIGHDRYILALGNWYRIAASFLAEVNQTVRSIPESPAALPDYHDRNETVYNARAQAESNGRFALMDCALIPHGGARSSIEFCDLYSLARELIHVKRYSGSSVMSHHFSQGVVSGRLLLRDAAFRTEVNARLPATHAIATPQENPRPSDYEVVYAVISQSAKPLHESLPFFSRVSLMTAYETLTLFGLRVSLRKINAVRGRRRARPRPQPP
jgi:uncharacterized protein (TIGR04141 family)